MKKPIIIISGPTASGKTSSSILISKYIQEELKKKAAVVNFDSLLFYREISIGTAKPTMQERDGIRHELIDISSIKSPLNASQYVELAKEKINSLLEEDYIVLLVGGSAFYLRALLKGMYDSPTVPEELREEIEQYYKKEGIEPIRDFLKENDKESYESLHENDHYRLIRAYEHFKLTGEKFSLQKQKMEENDPYDFSKHIHSNWDPYFIYLDLPKPEHQEIIEKRANQMFEDGLLNEVSSLLENGHSGEEKPLKSIGYKEVIDLLQGNFESQNQCVERIIISTRQLAKAQRTFFNKIQPKNSYHPLIDQAKMMADIKDFLKGKS